MYIDLRYVDWSQESERGKWLKLPERNKRFIINKNPLFRKKDCDCDAVFIAAELVTNVYTYYPEAQDIKPRDLFEDIVDRKYMHPPGESDDPLDYYPKPYSRHERSD